jgi:hypothetical protein
MVDYIKGLRLGLFSNRIEVESIIIEKETLYLFSIWNIFNNWPDVNVDSIRLNSIKLNFYAKYGLFD